MAAKILAGKTATSSAIKPQPEIRLTRGSNTPAPPRISAAPTVPMHQPDATGAAATHLADTADPAHTAPAPKTQPKRATSQLLGLPPTDREKEDNSAAAGDTVLLAYELVLHGGREEVVRVKSQLILPLALEIENLPQTDVSFPELFDQVIVRPLVTKFCSFLQRRFDAASKSQERANAAVEPHPPPVNMGYKPTRPGNGTSHEMPEIDRKPALPQRPSSAG